MEQARQRVIGAPGMPSFSVPFIEPAVDIYETEDQVVIVAEIAGIGNQDLELEGEGSKCILRGERKPASQGAKRDYRQGGNKHRPLSRAIFFIPGSKPKP